MEAWELSLITTSALALFFYAGKYVGGKKKTADIVDSMLDKLEQGNFIQTKPDEKTGEKELIAIDKPT